ncbi:MAG: hypothetical protein ABI333_18255 [bacterium]
MNSFAFTIAALVLIAGVFATAFVMLSRELRYVRLLADYLGYAEADGNSEGQKQGKPPASLLTERIRDEVSGVMGAAEPAWANKQVRGWQMRAQRLEAALAFWVDLLRQLGLLFTVLGLGLSLAIDPGNVGDLLQPLGLAVWTTVAGLALSLLLTTRFGMRVAVWADTCEKNIEAWDSRRRAAAAAKAPEP